MNKNDSVAALATQLSQCSTDLTPEGSWAFWSLLRLYERTAGIEPTVTGRDVVDAKYRALESLAVAA